MRRAILVTEEMREFIAFRAAGVEIDAALARGSQQAAKRRIKLLVKKLRESRLEEPVEYFLEIHKRWSHLLDTPSVRETRSFLETHWSRWATFEERLEMIRQTFSRHPMTEDVTATFECAIGELEGLSSSLGMGYRIGALAELMVERCRFDYKLRDELLALLQWCYPGVTRLSTYVSSACQRVYSGRPQEMADNGKVTEIRYGTLFSKLPSFSRPDVVELFERRFVKSSVRRVSLDPTTFKEE